MYIEATTVQGQAEVVLEFEYDGVSYADSVVLATPVPVSQTSDLGLLSWYSHPLYVAINAAMEAQGWEECDGYWVAPPPSVIESID